MIDKYPTKCNLCGGKVTYESNEIIYGKKYGSGYCYYCNSCKCHVGTHRPRPREALGILANTDMKKGKIICHEIFDSKWKYKLKAHKKREDLYKWLSYMLNIEYEECHFGYFDLDTLRRAYKVLLKIKDEPLKYNQDGYIINRIEEIE